MEGNSHSTPTFVKQSRRTLGITRRPAPIPKHDMQHVGGLVHAIAGLRH
jgi:hypothetical protein